MHHVLVRIPFHALEVFGDRATGDCHAVAVQVTVVQQRLHQKRYSTSLEHIFGHITATRLQIGDIRCLFEDFGNVEQIEFNSAFVRHGRQMQRSIGRAARRRHHSSRVFQGLTGDDVARTNVQRDQFHDLLARRHAEGVADFVRRRRASRVRQRKADGLGDGRHGVGSKLSTARACRRTRHPFDFVQILVGHFADRVLADRLEHVLDGDLLAPEIAGQDRAAIDEDRRHIEAQHRHHHTGQGLVAAREPDQGVISVATDGQFN